MSSWSTDMIFSADLSTDQEESSITCDSNACYESWEDNEVGYVDEYGSDEFDEYGSDEFDEYESNEHDEYESDDIVECEPDELVEYKLDELYEYELDELDTYELDEFEFESDNPYDYEFIYECNEPDEEGHATLLDTLYIDY
ncbi:hypothetical protein BD770DRAFT_381590 [Pilaira anomala]|nr:hypothetical protein BD770DRAFT_381590 [Pilaira anomala]